MLKIFHAQVAASHVAETFPVINTLARLANRIAAVEGGQHRGVKVKNYPRNCWLMLLPAGWVSGSMWVIPSLWGGVFVIERGDHFAFQDDPTAQIQLKLSNGEEAVSSAKLDERANESSPFLEGWATGGWSGETE